MIRALPAWPRPDRVERKEQLAVAAAGARLLYSRGARRVWLFGSIAKGRKLGVHSDFDFATEGLPWLFRAVSEPRRLALRYLRYNSLFLFYLAKEALTPRD